MKRLDTFENTIEGKVVKAQLTYVSPKGISITLYEPFKCTSGCYISKPEMAKLPLAVKENDEYNTTETGDQLASRFLKTIYYEACCLVNQKEKVQRMIESLIAQMDPFPLNLQREFFPTIFHIDMDLEFLDMFAREILDKDYDLLGLFYPSFRKNPDTLNLKQGDKISVLVDGHPISGRVNVLTRLAVCVSLESPIECFASRYSNTSRFANIVDGHCLANEEGVATARELLGKLSEQAAYLVEHRIEMGMFIQEYISRRDYIVDSLRTKTMKELKQYNFL